MVTLNTLTTWMDLNEISWTEKDKCGKFHLCVEIKKQNKRTNKMKWKQTHRYTEQNDVKKLKPSYTGIL